jgi:chemotaxis protein MotB
MAKKNAHHGGAWKVAYADFVTAMMALFMVLWICAQDKKILLSTSRYFQSPFKSPLSANSGVMPFDKAPERSDNSSSKDESSAGQDQPDNRNKQIELSFLNAVAADFYRLLHVDEDLAQKPIDVQVTSDGLRVTLFDRAKRPLFTEDGAGFTEWGRFVMQNLAWLIDRHRFFVTIDGHTRANMVYKRQDYTGWELSVDRANASRRSLVYYAVDPRFIERVTGYADTIPIPGEPPSSESNERITISLALLARAHPGETAAGGRPVTPPARVGSIPLPVTFTPPSS